MLPSGVFYDHTTSMNDNGMALNIPLLLQEIRFLSEQNVPDPRLLVSDRAQIVMPYHILFDQYEEERLGGKSFGSTKSGISPQVCGVYGRAVWNPITMASNGLAEKVLSTDKEVYGARGRRPVALPLCIMKEGST